MYTLNNYLKETYGRKLYKISLDMNFSCPNRDGTAGYGGCIFCSAGGSGDFAEHRNSDALLSFGKKSGVSAADEMNPGKTDGSIGSGKAAQYTSSEILTMLENGKRRVAGKFKPTYDGPNYIAYFQAYTNTYADVKLLREIFTAAINSPDVAILSIATRPDCLGDDIVQLLSELNKIKPVWVELGLQTSNDETAEFINRCYKTAVYDDAVERLNREGIKVITHVILGLPNETEADMASTVRHVVDAGSWGIKLQLLHVLKGTRLAKIYAENPFHVMSFEEYLELLKKLLELIPDDMVIHRLTGDGPKDLLIEPRWTLDKKRVMDAVYKL